MDEPEQASRPFEIHRLRGRSVIDVNGDDVGRIEDVVVEPGTWKVSAFRVRLNRGAARAMGVEANVFDAPAVEVSAERVRSVGDHVLLRIGRGTIADAMGATGPAHEAFDAPAAPFAGPRGPHERL